MKLLASFSVGSMVLSVIAFILVLLAHFWPSLLGPGSILIFLFALFLTVKELWPGRVMVIHDLRFIMAGIILVLLLAARFAFLSHIIMPGYSDSPIHYQIVFGFLYPDASGGSKLSLGNIFNDYYHFGFHSIAAWLTSLTSFSPENVISLLGQMFLVVAPVSVILLTHVLTKNINGALFAGLLAATGWLMPAFSVNWGKFPALASLTVLPSALALSWLYWQDGNKKPINLFWMLVLLLGITLLHTRIIICISIAVLSLFLSSKLRIGDELGFFQAVRFSLLYMLSLWPLSQLLVDFYRGIPMLVVFLILLPFAFQAYPKLSVGIFFYTFGLWLIVLAPSLLIKSFPALLDRQFIEIMLYIPFSVMGGAGFIGIMKKMPSQKALRWLAVIALMGGATYNFLQGRTIYPDKCCDYVKEGDRLAFQWIQKNASEHTLFLISTFDGGRTVFGTDAGIWLDPLLGKHTNKLPFTLDWESSEEIGKICNTDAAEIYVYMGGRPYSFANAKLAQGQWTKPVFTAGRTIIYQVSGCSD
jgi:hypothetical protein